MSKALINALTLAILEWGTRDWPVGAPEAKNMAAAFVEENADLLAPAPQVLPPAVQSALRRDTLDGTSRATVTDVGEDELAGVPDENLPRALKHYVPVVGPDGLTDVQRAAIGGVGLCKNCQQPRNRHLPGCAVASGEVPKAVTKTALPPVV